jgi:hypothetical protein
LVRPAWLGLCTQRCARGQPLPPCLLSGDPAHRTAPYSATTSTSENASGSGRPALGPSAATNTRDPGETSPASRAAGTAYSGGAGEGGGPCRCVGHRDTRPGSTRGDRDTAPTEQHLGSGTGDLGGADLAIVAYGWRPDPGRRGRGGGRMRAPAWMSRSCSRASGIGYGEERLIYCARFYAATNSDKWSDHNFCGSQRSRCSRRRVVECCGGGHDAAPPREARPARGTVDAVMRRGTAC